MGVNDKVIILIDDFVVDPSTAFVDTACGGGVEAAIFTSHRVVVDYTHIRKKLFINSDAVVDAKTNSTFILFYSVSDSR